EVHPPEDRLEGGDPAHASLQARPGAAEEEQLVAPLLEAAREDLRHPVHPAPGGSGVAQDDPHGSRRPAVRVKGPRAAPRSPAAEAAATETPSRPAPTPVLPTESQPTRSPRRRASCRGCSGFSRPGSDAAIIARPAWGAGSA